jgi:hypothetical protein
MTFYTQDGNTDTEEGPGRSLTSLVAGCIGALLLWTAVWYGVASFFDAIRPTH